MALHSFLGSSELQAITLQTTELFALQLVGVCCRCCCLLLVVVVCCWLSLFVVGCCCLLSSLFVVICCFLLLPLFVDVRCRYCWLSSSFVPVVVFVCFCFCRRCCFSTLIGQGLQDFSTLNVMKVMKIQPLQMGAAHIIYVNHDYHCCQRYIRSTFFLSHTNMGIATCQSTENDYMGLYVLYTRRQTGNKAHIVITAGIKLAIELACLLSSLNTIGLAERQEREWWLVRALFWVFWHGAIIQCFRFGLTESLPTYSTMKILPTSPFYHEDPLPPSL